MVVGIVVGVFLAIGPKSSSSSADSSSSEMVSMSLNMRRSFTKEEALTLERHLAVYLRVNESEITVSASKPDRVKGGHTVVVGLQRGLSLVLVHGADLADKRLADLHIKVHKKIKIKQNKKFKIENISIASKE